MSQQDNNSSWGWNLDHGNSPPSQYNPQDWQRAQQLRDQGLNDQQIQAAIQYDRDRAYHAGIGASFASDAARAKAGAAQPGGIRPYYDAETDTFKYYDPTAKKWQEGITRDKIYALLSEQLRQQYAPGQLENEATVQRRNWLAANNHDPYFDPTTGDVYSYDPNLKQYAMKGHGAQAILGNLTDYQKSLHPDAYWQDYAQQAESQYKSNQLRQADRRVMDSRLANPTTTYKYGATGADGF